MPDPNSAASAAGVAATLTGTEALDHVSRLARASRFASLAGASGAALAGLRATADLGGPDFLASLERWREAGDRRLPLVVHLAARAARAALGSGHDACHAAASASPLVLFAANVQEAVDLSLAARRVAEQALVPALVALDGTETADAVQTLELPSPELVAGWLGDAGETIHPPTLEQEVLFGKHRRRVPRWHDLERPLLAGPLLGPEAFALAQAARQTYAGVHVPGLLDAALEELGRRTGRPLGTLAAERTGDARLVLVAQGAAVETAVAVAELLREKERLKVGVVGIRALQPFPAAELVRQLAKARVVAVLERVTPGAAGGPLTTAVRGALAGQSQAVPPPQGKTPRLTTVFYGLGGFPLRGADLVALCQELGEAAGTRRTSRPPRSTVHLGVDFLADATPYPKRRVLLDALLRDYPAIAELGLRARGAAVDLTPRGSVTIAVCGPAEAATRGLAAEAGRLLHRVAGGQVRGRPGLTWEGWGGVVVERMIHAPRRRKKTSWPLYDPGDAVRADVAVAWEGEAPLAGVLAEVGDGGTVILEAPPDERALHRLAAVTAVELFTLPRLDPADGGGDLATRRERLLGALAAILRTQGKVNVQARRLFAARREMLDGSGDRDGEALAAAFEAGFTQVGRWTPPAPEGEAPRPAADTVPLAARRYALKEGDTYPGSLPRFWDRIGVSYRRGDGGDLVPDPLLATATVPAASATLGEVSRSRTMLPAFDPGPCTACGACWTSCPDGAVTPVVLGIRALLERGMTRADRPLGAIEGGTQERGTPSAALRPVLGKLTSAIRRETANSEEGDLRPRFDAAFAAVAAKAADDRRAAMQESWEAVRAALRDLPMARTATFFDVPENGGDLFALAIDPDACKGCGVCVAECEPGALARVADSPGRSATARRLRDLVDSLPEPSPEAVVHARHSAEAGPLSGALLPRHAREVLVGGDAGEAGSGEKIAVRQVLGAAVFHGEPVRQGFLDEIAELRTALAAAVRDGLASTLPGDDLDALARGLESLERPDVVLADLVPRIESSFESERLDVVRLRRLVDAARKLADLDYRVTPGEGRKGWAPFSVVVAGRPAVWAAEFPRNPFTVPVTVAGESDVAALVEGLAAGQLQSYLDAVSALRRARRLLDRPDPHPQPLRSRPAPKGERGARSELLWQDLTPEERRAAPPLLVIASEDAVGEDDVRRLFRGTQPIKLVFLDGGGATVRASWAASPPDAADVRSSISHPDHLDAATAGLLAHDGAAFLRVLAPSPGRGGFAPEDVLAEARRRVEEGLYELTGEPPASAGEARDGPAPAVDEDAAAAGVSVAEHERLVDAARSEVEREMVDRLRSRLRHLAYRAIAQANPTDAGLEEKT